MRRLSTYDSPWTEAWMRLGVCIRAVSPHFIGPIGAAWCREAKRLADDLARATARGSRKANTAASLADRVVLLRQALGGAQVEAVSRQDELQLAATAIAVHCLVEAERLLRGDLV
jgi:hypothetical protein